MSLLCFDSRACDSSRSRSSLQPLLLQRLTRLLPCRHQRRLQPRSQRTCNRPAWDLPDDRPPSYMKWNMARTTHSHSHRWPPPCESTYGFCLLSSVANRESIASIRGVL